MPFAVETSDVCHRVGKDFAISGLSLQVPAGSIYGFLGPNGSGKTTTFRLLLGLLKPESGRITMLGESMPDHYATILARTGVVPERPHLYPNLTIDEAMRFHAAFHAKWDDVRATELVKMLGLPRDRRISALSKGETGKLMMLLALAQRPDLLVLDEPTDGLDPVVRRDVLGALLDYVAATDATVVIASHLVHEIERICDWIGVMDRGRMLVQLPTAELKGGIKRLRVASAITGSAPTPFEVLSKSVETGSGEQWLIRGWSPNMSDYFDAAGVELREVIDLDLEDAFVELLHSARSRDLIVR
jgi:ABC-type multidrug transport system ATPase subunit